MAKPPRLATRLEGLGRTITPREARRKCWDKLVFGARTAARDAAKKAERRGIYLSPYRCQLCGEWHLTSMTDREVEAMRNHRPRILPMVPK